MSTLPRCLNCGRYIAVSTELFRLGYGHVNASLPDAYNMSKAQKGALGREFELTKSKYASTIIDNRDLLQLVGIREGCDCCAIEALSIRDWAELYGFTCKPPPSLGRQ